METRSFYIQNYTSKILAVLSINFNFQLSRLQSPDSTPLIFFSQFFFIKLIKSSIFLLSSWFLFYQNDKKKISGPVHSLFFFSRQFLVDSTKSSIFFVDFFVESLSVLSVDKTSPIFFVESTNGPKFLCRFHIFFVISTKKNRWVHCFFLAKFFLTGW